MICKQHILIHQLGPSKTHNIDHTGRKVKLNMCYVVFTLNCSSVSDLVFVVIGADYLMPIHCCTLSAPSCYFQCPYNIWCTRQGTHKPLWFPAPFAPVKEEQNFVCLYLYCFFVCFLYLIMFSWTFPAMKLKHMAIDTSSFRTSDLLRQVYLYLICLPTMCFSTCQWIIEICSAWNGFSWPAITWIQMVHKLWPNYKTS